MAADAAGGEADPAWEALARAAEVAPDGLTDAAVAALVCAARGSAPGRMRGISSREATSDTAEVTDASGRVVWTGPRAGCPDLAADAALDLLAALLPGWSHAVDEDEADGSVEVALCRPGGPGGLVRATGRTVALGLTAALCRAMARAGR